MKTIGLLISILMLTMCNAQNEDKKIIVAFLENVVLDDAYEVENGNEYLDIGTHIPENRKEGLYQLIQLQIGELREKLNDSNITYEIIAHNTAKDDKRIKSYNLIYDDYDNVYYLINDREIITFFIIYKGKIRAFFPGITKKSGRKNPFLLNVT